jgi:hypothetical protein
MHGGAAGSGAPRGARNGAWRHGGRSGEVAALRRLVRELLREARGLVGLAREGAPVAVRRSPGVECGVTGPTTGDFASACPDAPAAVA